MGLFSKGKEKVADVVVPEVKKDNVIIDVKSEQFKDLRDTMTQLLNTLSSLSSSLQDRQGSVYEAVLDSKNYSGLVKTHKQGFNPFIEGLDKKANILIESVNSTRKSIESLISTLDISEDVKGIATCSTTIKDYCERIMGSTVSMGSIIDDSLQIINAIDIDFDSLIETVENIRTIANTTTESINSVNKLIINAIIEASRAEEDKDKYKIVTKKIGELTTESGDSNKILLSHLDSMITLFKKANAGKKSYDNINSDKDKHICVVSSSISSVNDELAKITNYVNNIESLLYSVKQNFTDVILSFNDITTKLESIKNDFNDNEKLFSNSIEDLRSLEKSYDNSLKYLEVLKSSIDLVDFKVKGILKLNEKFQEL